MINKNRFNWGKIVFFLIFIGSLVNILFYNSNLPKKKSFLDSIPEMAFSEILSLFIIGLGILVLTLNALSEAYDIFFIRRNRQSKLIKNMFQFVLFIVFLYFMIVLTNLYWEKELVFSISKMKFFYGWYGVFFFAIVIAVSYVLIMTGIVKVNKN